jgi:hypothetical protein
MEMAQVVMRASGNRSGNRTACTDPLPDDGGSHERLARQDTLVGELQPLGQQAGLRQFRHECAFALRLSNPGIR